MTQDALAFCPCCCNRSQQCVWLTLNSRTKRYDFILLRNVNGQVRDLLHRESPSVCSVFYARSGKSCVTVLTRSFTCSMEMSMSLRSSSLRSSAMTFSTPFAPRMQGAPTK